MAMHDGMSTFFIVTTSDLIGLDSKTAKLYMRNFNKEAKLLAIVFCYSDWLLHANGFFFHFFTEI